MQTSPQSVEDSSTLNRFESLSSQHLSIQNSPGNDQEAAHSQPMFYISRYGEVIYDEDAYPWADDQEDGQLPKKTQIVLPKPVIITPEQREIEMRREKKWLEMYVNWDEYLKKPDLIKSRVRKGIPESLRGVVWSLLTDANGVRNEANKRYGIDASTLVFGPGGPPYSTTISSSASGSRLNNNSAQTDDNTKLPHKDENPGDGQSTSQQRVVYGLGLAPRVKNNEQSNDGKGKLPFGFLPRTQPRANNKLLSSPMVIHDDEIESYRASASLPARRSVSRSHVEEGRRDLPASGSMQETSNQRVSTTIADMPMTQPSSPSASPSDTLPMSNTHSSITLTDASIEGYVLVDQTTTAADDAATSEIETLTLTHVETDGHKHGHGNPANRPHVSSKPMDQDNAATATATATAAELDTHSTREGQTHSVAHYTPLSPSSTHELAIINTFTYTFDTDQDPPSNLSLFRRLASKPSPMDSLIAKDVPRTFPTHALFSGSKRKLGDNRARIALADLCRAYCNYDPGLGYCQGISFLAATLILYMEADDAFWVLVAMLNSPKYNTRRLFMTGFPLLQEYIFIVDQLMHHVDPKLAKHLKDIEFEYSVFMPQWFMCLFVYNLPMSISLRIWDIFFSEGNKILVRTALYLITYYRKQLLRADPYSAATILCHDLPNDKQLVKDADKFITAVLKVNITNAQVEHYSQLYRETHGAE